LEREDFERAAPTLRELEVAWTDQGRTGWLAIVKAAWLPVFASREAWPQFDDALEASRALLAESAIVEVDLARVYELAADVCRRSGDVERVALCWRLALSQWSALKAGDAILRVEARLQAAGHPATP
jgi:hypothetical protein